MITSQLDYHTPDHVGTSTSKVCRDAIIEARALSTDAIMAELEVLALDISDPDPDWPGDIGRWLAGERLRAFEAELDRRARIWSMPASTAAKYAEDCDAWAHLARTVRETVSVPEALLLVGCAPTRAGTRRNGEAEYHGPCPQCGGTDRLVSWDGPRSRCWCRRCDWRANVITIMQAHFPGCAHFRDAVRTLANLALLAGERP